MKIEDIKVGDKVVCTKEFHEDVTVGREYKVVDVYSMCFCTVDDTGCRHNVYSIHFEKVIKEQPTPKSLLKNGDVVLFEDGRYFRYLDLESEMSGFYSHGSHNPISFYHDNLESRTSGAKTGVVEIYRPNYSHHLRGECLSKESVEGMDLIWSRESYVEEQQRLEEIKTLEETISKAKEKIEELLSSL